MAQLSDDNMRFAGKWGLTLLAGVVLLLIARWLFIHFYELIHWLFVLVLFVIVAIAGVAVLFFVIRKADPGK
jgi:hypothetical protein